MRERELREGEGESVNKRRERSRQSAGSGVPGEQPEGRRRNPEEENLL